MGLPIVRNRGVDKKPLDALRELDRLGGRGHLQDIRQGAFGTKIRRAFGGHEADK
jgi:hypothetical protein